LSITEADVGHIFVGEQNFPNLARFDPPQESVLWRQDVLLGRSRGDGYRRRVSLKGGCFASSLATQETEEDYSNKGRVSPHYFVGLRRAADCSALGNDVGTPAEGRRYAKPNFSSCSRRRRACSLRRSLISSRSTSARSASCSALFARVRRTAWAWQGLHQEDNVSFIAGFRGN
jgi:hypothetical protein